MINTVLVIVTTFGQCCIKKLPVQYDHLISALNGREALDMLEGRNVDVIVLGLAPVMDGLDFLKEFKKTFHNTILIIITSLDSEETIGSVIKEYEVFDYIIKPLDQINRMILLNKIRTAISYRNALKELFSFRRQNKEDGN